MLDVVIRFEETFAEWLGTGHAFAFWKGRVALYAILRALGIGEGDEVILPGYTCVMDVNPIKYLGARAVFVDIEPTTYNLDVRLLEEKITPRTKIVIAQHTYGYPCEMDGILEIAGRRDEVNRLARVKGGPGAPDAVLTREEIGDAGLAHEGRTVTRGRIRYG